MTEMYLGYPPANIEAWISAHYEPTPTPTLTEGGYWKREDGVLFAGGLKDPSHETPIIWNESDSEWGYMIDNYDPEFSEHNGIPDDEMGFRVMDDPNVDFLGRENCCLKVLSSASHTYIWHALNPIQYLFWGYGTFIVQHQGGGSSVLHYHSDIGPSNGMYLNASENVSITNAGGGTDNKIFEVTISGTQYPNVDFTTGQATVGDYIITWIDE